MQRGIIDISNFSILFVIRIDVHGHNRTLIRLIIEKYAGLYKSKGGYDSF